MGIEKDIQQLSFKSEYQKVIINLVYTYHWTMGQCETFFDRFDLTYQQFNILRILRGAARPLSILKIREKMLDKMSDTSRIVDRLVIKEMVKKSVNKLDKRLVDVVITAAGLSILKKIDQKESDLFLISSNLSEPEAHSLNELLDKFRHPC